MSAKTTFRKVASAGLMLLIALWAEAGVALVQGDQVMQCSMSMHEMQSLGAMSCCPMDEAQAPSALSERPPCCSVSNVPEQPLGFIVSSDRVKAPSLQVLAVAQTAVAELADRSIGQRHDADAPQFVKPVLELKTDLRI
jgi:hypothetical protein